MKDFDKPEDLAFAEPDTDVRDRGEGMSSKLTSELRATGREDPLLFLRVGEDGICALDKYRTGAQVR